MSLGRGSEAAPGHQGAGIEETHQPYGFSCTLTAPLAKATLNHPDVRPPVRRLEWAPKAS